MRGEIKQLKELIIDKTSTQPMSSYTRNDETKLIKNILLPKKIVEADIACLTLLS